jgi:hypothetical protein
MWCIFSIGIFMKPHEYVANNINPGDFAVVPGEKRGVLLDIGRFSALSGRREIYIFSGRLPAISGGFECMYLFSR